MANWKDNILIKLERFRISLDDVENGRKLNLDFVFNKAVCATNGHIK